MASPIQYIGAIQMQAPAGRFAPLNRQDVDFVRRWVFPVDKEASQIIDTFDKLKILQDPTSQYSDVAAAAVAREWDDRIIGAAFATSQIGQDAGGLTSEVFNTGSTVTGAGWQIPSTFGSAAASGLTVAKMIEAKRAFRKAQVDVDMEPLCWVTNSQGESDLLNQVQVVSHRVLRRRSPDPGRRQGRPLHGLRHHLLGAPDLDLQRPPEYRPGEIRRLPRHLARHRQRHHPAQGSLLAALPTLYRHVLGRDPA